MATRTRSDCQKFIHDNYNAVVSPGGTKTAGTRPDSSAYLINSLYVENMDLSIDIYLSFDGGTKWKTVKAGTWFSIQCDSLASYMVKSASGTPAVECVYGVEN